MLGDQHKKITPETGVSILSILNMGYMVKQFAGFRKTDWAKQTSEFQQRIKTGRSKFASPWWKCHVFAVLPKAQILPKGGSPGPFRMAKLSKAPCHLRHIRQICCAESRDTQGARTGCALCWANGCLGQPKGTLDELDELFFGQKWSDFMGKIITGCWFFATPLKNMSSSIGMIRKKPNISGKIKLMATSHHQPDQLEDRMTTGKLTASSKLRRQPFTWRWSHDGFPSG